MVTIQEIKALYPAPATSNYQSKHLEETCYCVGGAIVAALTGYDLFHDKKYSVRFPSNNILARALIAYFPTVPGELCNAVAKHVIEHNDKGNFKKAWKTVEDFMKFSESMQ